MNKPFDLAAAQRGEPIEVLADIDNSIWIDAHFVGITKDGCILFEFPCGYSTVEIKYLRMKENNG